MIYNRHLQDFCPRLRQDIPTFLCSHLCTNNYLAIRGLAIFCTCKQMSESCTSTKAIEIAQHYKNEYGNPALKIVHVKQDENVKSFLETLQRYLWVVDDNQILPSLRDYSDLDRNR